MRSVVFFSGLALVSLSASASDIRCQGSGRFADIHIYNDVNFVSAIQAPLIQTDTLKVSVKVDTSMSPAQLAIEVEERAPNGNLLSLRGAAAEISGPVQYMDSQESRLTCVNMAAMRAREEESRSKLHSIYQYLRSWF
jgi:hypothetical protein